MTAAFVPGQYLGVDPHACDLAAQIESAVRAHLPNDDLTHHIYALIDGALDEVLGLELLQASQARNPQVCSVYAGTPLEGAEECSPFLQRVGRSQLSQLLARCNRKPMLSFIQTPLELHALQRHLGGFLRARTPDGMTLALRIADPIGLRDIVAAMEPSFNTPLRAGFAAWHVIGRDGNAHSWPGLAVPGALPGFRTEPWPLSNKAYTQILDSGEADRLLCVAVRKNVALLGTHSTAELHRRVLGLMAALDAAGVQDTPRRSQWIARALEQADEQAAVMWLKEQIRRPGRSSGCVPRRQTVLAGSSAASS